MYRRRIGCTGKGLYVNEKDFIYRRRVVCIGKALSVQEKGK